MTGRKKRGDFEMIVQIRWQGVSLASATEIEDFLNDGLHRETAVPKPERIEVLIKTLPPAPPQSGPVTK